MLKGFKPFRKATKDDITRLMVGIKRNENWSASYKRDIKVALRIFYKWLKRINEKGKYPPEVDWIEILVKNNNLPREILTKKEIKKIISVTNNARNRALVSVLYESGCRIGEILTLKIGNIEFDDYGAFLSVKGKTGSRRVRIIKSVPDLSNWLNIHPLGGSREAFVWVVTKKGFNPLCYHSVNFMIHKLAEKAGIKKNVTPHTFRHARATHLANHLTEAQMKQFFGWTQGSRMAAVYVHLSGRDVDDTLLNIYGIKKGEKEDHLEINFQECQRCKEKNDSNSQFCWRCGTPLTLKTALDFKEKWKEKDELAAIMIERVYQKIQKLILNKLNIDVEDVVYKTIKEMILEEKFEKL